MPDETTTTDQPGQEPGADKPDVIEGEGLIQRAERAAGEALEATGRAARRAENRLKRELQMGPPVGEILLYCDGDKTSPAIVTNVRGGDFVDLFVMPAGAAGRPQVEVGPLDESGAPGWRPRD